MANRTSEDFERERNNQTTGVRSVLDYLVAAAFIIIGIVCFVKYSADTTMVVFGVVAVLYGIWRLYKVYKKKV